MQYQQSFEIGLHGRLVTSGGVATVSHTGNRMLQDLAVRLVNSIWGTGRSFRNWRQCDVLADEVRYTVFVTVDLDFLGTAP